MKVASDGLSRSCDVVIGAQIDSRNNNNLPHQNMSGGYGADINVPVYATVKGVRKSINPSSEGKIKIKYFFIVFRF